MWEFKHGNGNFKRGDLVGLREIKRRASRHALIHRDSFPSHKAAASQPGTPAEPLPDANESRLMTLEHALFDMHSRLSRAEEGNAALNVKCQGMAESLTRCYHVSCLVVLPARSVRPNRSSFSGHIPYPASCRRSSQTERIHCTGMVRQLIVPNHWRFTDVKQCQPCSENWRGILTPYEPSRPLPRHSYPQDSRSMPMPRWTLLRPYPHARCHRMTAGGHP